MKISKRSWHYRLVRILWADSDWEIERLTPLHYFLLVIMLGFLYILLMPLFIFVEINSYLARWYGRRKRVEIVD